MKQIIRAQASKLCHPEDPIVEDQSSNTASVEEVPMPDIYDVEDDATVPLLEIPKQPCPEVGDTAAFDLYDTVKMPKK